MVYKTKGIPHDIWMLCKSKKTERLMFRMMNKKTFQLLSYCTLFLLSLNGFSQIHQIESKVKDVIEKKWKIKVKRLDSTTTPHPSLVGGNFEAILTFTHKKDQLVFYLYYSKDSTFYKKISSYQTLGGCRASRQPLIFYHWADYYLLLPFHPCISGYNEESQNLIDQIVNNPN